jgi:hypothetical protein
MNKSLLVAVVLLLLSGANQASAAPDVTKLVTKAEVEAALGTKMDSVVKELPPPLGGTQVTFTSSSMPVKTFALTVRTPDSFGAGMKAAGYTPTKLYDQTKNLSGAGVKPLVVKGGTGYSAASRSEVLKNGIQLSATTLFGTSDQATKVRDTLILKAADRL